MVRTLPSAFARLLGRAGKRRIKTVEMPVEIAEIAVDHVAAAHGRLVAFETEDDVVFAVLELQRIQRQIVTRARSEAVIRYEASILVVLTWLWMLEHRFPRTRRRHP